MAETLCRQLEAVNLFMENQWLYPMPWSAFVWSDDRSLAYYETFQHLTTRALVAASLVQPEAVADAVRVDPNAEESAVGTVLNKAVAKATGGAFAVLLMHRTFAKVSAKRQSERVARLRLTSDMSAIPPVMEAVARTLVAGRGPLLQAASDLGAEPALPTVGTVFGKGKLGQLLNGLTVNGEADARIRRAQLMAVADCEALLDWLMTRSTPEARDELKRLPPQSETLISRLVTAVTLSRPL